MFLNGPFFVLFRAQDLSRIRVYLDAERHRMWTGQTPLSDFVFNKEVKLSKYGNGNGNVLPCAAVVAAKRAQRDPSALPLYGERVSANNKQTTKNQIEFDRGCFDAVCLFWPVRSHMLSPPDLIRV